MHYHLYLLNNTYILSGHKNKIVCFEPTSSLKIIRCINIHFVRTQNQIMQIWYMFVHNESRISISHIEERNRTSKSKMVK